MQAPTTSKSVKCGTFWIKACTELSGHLCCVKPPPHRWPEGTLRDSSHEQQRHTLWVALTRSAFLSERTTTCSPKRQFRRALYVLHSLPRNEPQKYLSKGGSQDQPFEPSLPFVGELFMKLAPFLFQFHRYLETRIYLGCHFTS